MALQKYSVIRMTYKGNSKWLPVTQLKTSYTTSYLCSKMFPKNVSKWDIARYWLKTVTPNAVVLNAPVRVILPQFCNVLGMKTLERQKYQVVKNSDTDRKCDGLNYIICCACRAMHAIKHTNTTLLYIRYCSKECAVLCTHCAVCKFFNICIIWIRSTCKQRNSAKARRKTHIIRTRGVRNVINCRPGTHINFERVPVENSQQYNYRNRELLERAPPSE